MIAAIITDRETGRSRGFGFVEMPDDAGRTAGLLLLRVPVRAAYKPEDPAGRIRAAIGGKDAKE